MIDLYALDLAREAAERAANELRACEAKVIRQQEHLNAALEAESAARVECEQRTAELNDLLPL